MKSLTSGNASSRRYSKTGNGTGSDSESSKNGKKNVITKGSEPEKKKAKVRENNNEEGKNKSGNVLSEDESEEPDDKNTNTRKSSNDEVKKVPRKKRERLKSITKEKYYCEKCEKDLGSLGGYKYHTTHNVCEKEKEKQLKKEKKMQKVLEKKARSDERLRKRQEKQEEKERKKRKKLEEKEEKERIREVARRKREENAKAKEREKQIRDEKIQKKRILDELKDQNRSKSMTRIMRVEEKKKSINRNAKINQIQRRSAAKNQVTKGSKYTFSSIDDPEHRELLFPNWTVPSDPHVYLIKDEPVSKWINGAAELFLQARAKNVFSCEEFLPAEPEPYSTGKGQGIKIQPFRAKPCVLSEQVSPETEMVDGEDHDKVKTIKSPDFLLHTAKRVTSVEFCPSCCNTEVYLAVGTIEANDKVHVMGYNNDSSEEKDRNAIQLWSVEDKTSEMRYAVNIPGGPAVISMCWCPGKNPAVCKAGIGLLAVALTSGYVYVFAMPKPGANTKTGNTIELFEGDVLSVFTTKILEASLTCIDWHPKWPHKCLFAGLSNGSIAVWNVERISVASSSADKMEKPSSLPVSKDDFTSNYPVLRLTPSSTELTRQGLGAASAAARHGIIDICCSRDASVAVASISNDCMLRIWDIRQPVAPVIDTVVNANARLSSLSWPAGTDYLLIGDEAGGVRFLELVQGTSRQVKFHRGSVTCLVSNPRFSPMIMLSCASDGAALCWLGPKYVSHVDGKEKGDLIATASRLQEWSKRRKTSKTTGGVVECTPVGLFQLHEELRKTKDHNKSRSNDLLPDMLYSPNGAEIPLAGSSPAVNSEFTVPAKEPVPNQLRLNCVAWGRDYRNEEDSNDSRFEWIAFGGNASVVRLRRITIPTCK